VHRIVGYDFLLSIFYLRLKMASSLENLSLQSKEDNNEDDVVDPWNVSSKNKTGIDYNKLISK